ncbi:phosphate acetyltransferase [Atopostipes suicloacalis DSM 15692]|uniref:Phosphate acetyltransferase n=1 Tax=Atopostipes suicloacalis DSM 15692 TaxID=1121025 RepID=A0A1M4V0Z1_9LACT|nr:phosphate acetyltransferase [Atopostipes suicloacalis]SHE62646.1 phosphate acetyltransferase [Atopostipes suicloacalis DSM 15692]
MFDALKSKIAGKDIRIVFPEAMDPRVLGAVVRLKRENLLEPVLLGNPDEINESAKAQGFDLTDIEIHDPKNYDKYDEMVASFVERRKGKATEEQAREMLQDVNYFGTMLVYMDVVDGLISGAIHSTSDTVRPALQIVKTRPGVNLTSGAFIMLRKNDRFLFSDCAINPDPNAEQLAEIAVESARTAEIFDIDPKVALLSFSTKGSGKGPMVDKVREATEIAKENAPELALDGELQFDSAFDTTVAQQKAPESDVAGVANVFVFPELQSGNIGYKIAQRLGGFEAIGPILQGLNKPIADLSRGCIEEDVYKLSIITANQALLNDK